MKTGRLILLPIDPNHPALSLPLAIHKIANIKITILINLYPDSVPLIQHQLALINLAFGANDDPFTVSLAIDYSPNVQFILIDGYPWPAIVLEIGEGSGIEG